MRITFVFIIMTIGLVTFGQQADTTVKFVEFKDVPVGEEIYECFDCDQRASFPGGDAVLLRYIAENLKYTGSIEQNGIEGTAYIRFVVTKTGVIEQVRVLRALNSLLEEEAIKVVKSFPIWSPAKRNGNPVNSWYILPFRVNIR